MTPFYTDTIIADGSAGAIVSDSAMPAAYLNETYPSASLRCKKGIEVYVFGSFQPL